MGVRLIQVGLGGWGRNWQDRALPGVPEVECVGVVDTSAEAIARARDQLGLADTQCFGSLTTALANTDADAVLVTAPVEAHLPLATEALNADRHVLVEKPLGPSVAAAREVVELAERRGRIFAVSQNYRYYPAARTVVRLLGDGVLGHLGTVRLDFRKWANDHDPLKNKHYRLRHPLLFDMSVHHFDLMRMLLGQEPTRVFAAPTDPEWSHFDSVASVSAFVEFSGGTTVSYRGSWVSSGRPTPWSGLWHLECEYGELAWRGADNLGASEGRPGSDESVTMRRHGDDEPVAVELDAVERRGRTGTLSAFVEAIASGREPETSARRNLGTLALCEAAARSVESGKPEPVDIP